MGHSTIWTLEKRNISCFLPKIEPQFLIVTQPVAKSLHLLKQRLHTFFKSCGYEDSSCYFISDLTFFPRACSTARAERDGTRAETRFCLSPKRTSPFKSVGSSVQSTAGSRGVRISLSNAG